MPYLPTLDEIESFTEDASEVARLVDGLRSGSLPADFIDKRIEERDLKASKDKKKNFEKSIANQKVHDPEVGTRHPSSQMLNPTFFVVLHETTPQA